MMGMRLEGELPEEQVGELDRHLSQCADCEEHWQGISDVRSLLASGASVSASPELHSRLRAVVEREMSNAGEAEPLAEISMAQGAVLWRGDECGPWTPARGGESLAAGQEIAVGDEGRALLRLPGRGELWVNSGTVLRMGRQAAVLAVRLARGELLALLERQPSTLRVLTPDGAVAVMGTVFNTRAVPGIGTRVSVLRGRVAVATGGQSREIGERRSVDFVGDSGLGRTRHISFAEIRRVDGWTSPMRSATEVSGESAIDTVRRGTLHAGLLKVLGLFALILLALLVRNVRMKAESSPPTQALAEPLRSVVEIQARLDQISGIDVAESVTLSLAPRAGDHWTQTTHLWGPIYEEIRHPAGDGVDNRDVRITLLSEALVSEGEVPGQVRVEHTVKRAVVEDSPRGGEDEIYPTMTRVLQRLRSTLPRAKLIETLDSQGRLLGIEVIDPTPSPILLVLPEAVLRTLLITPAGASAGPVHEGLSWTHGQPSSDGQAWPLSTTSTFEQFEELDGERLVLIRSEGVADLDSPHQIGVDELGSLTASGRTGPATVTHTLNRQGLIWTQASHHRAVDGRRVLATGQIEQTYHVESRETRPEPDRWERHIHGRLQFEIVVEVEHAS
jgi:hypothetical protein